MSDENRIAREERVRQWMIDYGSMLKKICYISLSDLSLAEDAVQETFFKAWRAMDKFEGRNGCSEKTWLTQIAINICHDYHRSKWWRIRNVTKPMETVPTELLKVPPEERDMVLDILRLPEKYKEVILLYFYQEMTQKEIAEVLGMSRSLVNHRIHKALKMLKIAWGEEEVR